MLFASTRKVFRLSHEIIAHQRLRGLRFGQLSLPLFVFFKIVLIYKLVQARLQFIDLLLSFLDTLNELISFLFQGLLCFVITRSLGLPSSGLQRIGDRPNILFELRLIDTSKGINRLIQKIGSKLFRVLGDCIELLGLQSLGITCLLIGVLQLLRQGLFAASCILKLRRCIFCIVLRYLR